MNKSILITGSTGGIGQAIVERLINSKNDDYTLVLHYNSNKTVASELQKRVTSQGKECRILQFSSNNREQCRQVLEQDFSEYGSYYGIICNAGITRDNAFPAMSGNEWDEVLRTNLDGFYNVLQPLIMPMVRAKKGGRIITMSSVSGISGNRGQTNYSASKGGLIAASKSLAIELGKRNITVNCIAPGIIETEMTKDLDKNIIKQLIPLRRAGKTSEIASLVDYLLSGDAAYITRQVISVNGGMI